MNNFRNGQNDYMFDDDYIALLAIVSTVLQVYSIWQAEDDRRQTEKVLDRIEQRLDRIERRLNYG